jgi:hypothetical protein
VSVIIHILLPLLVALDRLLIGDRPPLRWRKLWLLSPTRWRGSPWCLSEE